MFRAALSTAAVVVAMLVRRRRALRPSEAKPDVAAPSPTAEASASPSQPAVVTATPTPTAEVPSLDLTWTEVDLDAGPGQVAWLDDHFVLVDSSGAVRTSTDGMSWDVLQPGDPDPGYAELLKERASLVTWEDQIVGWWNPEDGRDYHGQAPDHRARRAADRPATRPAHRDDPLRGAHPVHRLSGRPASWPRDHCWS